MNEIYKDVGKIETDKEGIIAEEITYLLTPWSRVLFEKLTGSQLLRQVPATCPYPVPARSRPWPPPHIRLPEDRS